MEYLKLLGILIIVVGFVLKWDTTVFFVCMSLGVSVVELQR